MILSHTHKFIFFCSSKVGTTSMEEVLRPLQEGAAYDFGSPGAGIVPKHIPPAILRGALPDKIWREYFKFVFVRNPWDWFISQWFYNSRSTESANLQALSRAGRLRTSARAALDTLRRRRLEDNAEALIQPPRDGYLLRPSDVDAMFEVLKRFKALPGRDGLYQSNWVYDMDNRVIVDYVGRYETIEDDFAKVMRHLKLDLVLPHLNRTEHGDYRSYYSSAARDRVAQLWAMDVENFGYSFDVPEAASETAVSHHLDPATARVSAKPAEPWPNADHR